MKHLKLKQKAFELFEEGGDIDSVAYDLGIDEAQSEIWFKEYNVEQSLAGLSDDPEQVQELLEAIQELNGLKREEINLYAKEKEEAELKERKLCMITFKKLFTFLKNHCQGFKWNYGEVILYVKKLKTLRGKVEAACNHDEEEFQRLFIWNRIEGLIDHLEQLVLNKEEGDTIKLNFDENDLLYLEEALEISDFTDEIVVETEEEQALDGILEEEFSPKKY